MMPGDVGNLGEEFWDERYRSHAALWSGEPNVHLVGEAAGLTPGTALDVGSGEGADAIWLAERGWQVTAVDFSAVALQRAADHARQRGSEVARRIEWVRQDLTTWDPGPERYDLVTAQYLHLPPASRRPLVRRLAATVAPGGTLLVAGHHPSDLQTTIPRPQDPDRYFTGGEVAAELDPGQWEIITDAAPGRTATDPEGRTVIIHDTVVRARRHD
jgi:2-polyprenyl-3-methyl-5-hydroxy-6-metoxy-1,4-benzoquinol methylase